MNVFSAIAGLAMLGSPIVIAQNVSEEPQPDPVLDAIQAFSQSAKAAPGEAGSPPAPVTPETAPLPADVAGSVAAAPAKEAPAEAAPTPREEPPTAPESGLTVRVEKVRAGNDVIDPSKVKLTAPFPAKPLGQPPSGWRLDTSDQVPPLTREVELSPGSKITLKIRPHVLVPDADGSAVFAVSEPGYDPALGYQQTSTVGAILANSIRQLDDDSKELGTAIENLQQLLVSLPRPPEPPAAVETAKPPALRRK